MRFLGIDYGNKRIGVAISDHDNSLAFPYATIINNGHKEAINKIAKIVKKEEISDIVVGLPMSFQFTETEQTKLTNNFIEFLRKNLKDINVYSENEILSTKDAMIKIEKVKNKKDIIDKTASCLILQGFLDKKNYGK